MKARPSFVHMIAGMVGMVMTTVAMGQDFRVESEVTLNDEKRPVGENLTLFAAGIVYDFSLAGPKEITIFDPAREQFVLLDIDRRMRLTLATRKVLEMNRAIRTASTDRDPYFFEPQFEESYEDRERLLTLTNKRIKYGAKGKVPGQDSIVQRYRNFADWYARLNATRPGTMPPFARLELNKSLAVRGIVPEEVNLTIYPKNRLFGSKTQATSKHLFAWRILETDKARIEKANHYRATFEEVSFRTYRGLDKAD
jgi:hypothetical protein